MTMDKLKVIEVPEIEYRERIKEVPKIEVQ